MPAMRSCSTWSSSITAAEQLFGRVDETEPLGDAGEVQQTLNLLRALDQPDLASLAGQALMGADEDAQARRVHEIELPEVNHHQLRARAGQLIELSLELRARREIELSADGDYGRPAVLSDLYPKLILHAGHEPTDLCRAM